MTNISLIFAGNPLDRHDELRGNSAALQALFEGAGLVLVLSADLKIMAKTMPLDLDWRKSSDIAEGWTDRVYLGEWNGLHRFAVMLDVASQNITALAEGVKMIDVRSFAMGMGSVAVDQGRTAILGQAKALLDWHARHGFCAKCGSETRSAHGGYRRICQSEPCKAEHFPRTDPAVIMLAYHGDKCLLGRQSFYPEGVYSTMAGFVEPGESLEEAVRREVMEESGIKAEHVDYIASQPWPFPSSLMIGAMVAVEDGQPHPKDGELEDVRWFNKEDVLKALDDMGPIAGLRLPPSISISRFLIETWAKNGPPH